MLKKEVTQGIDPLSILKQAVAAVPSLKYALGIVGIAAAIAIIKSFQIDYQIAVFGTVIMFFLMAVLVVFAKVARFSQGDLRLPALVLTWFALILVIATACVLYLCIFANWPLGFQELIRSITSPTHKAVGTQVLVPSTSPVKDVQIITPIKNTNPQASQVAATDKEKSEESKKIALPLAFKISTLGVGTNAASALAGKTAPGINVVGGGKSIAYFQDIYGHRFIVTHAIDEKGNLGPASFSVTYDKTYESEPYSHSSTAAEVTAAAEKCTQSRIHALALSIGQGTTSIPQESEPVVDNQDLIGLLDKRCVGGGWDCKYHRTKTGTSAQFVLNDKSKLNLNATLTTFALREANQTGSYSRSAKGAECKLIITALAY